ELERARVPERSVDEVGAGVDGVVVRQAKVHAAARGVGVVVAEETQEVAELRNVEDRDAQDGLAVLGSWHVAANRLPDVVVDERRQGVGGADCEVRDEVEEPASKPEHAVEAAKEEVGEAREEHHARLQEKREAAVPPNEPERAQEEQEDDDEAQLEGPARLAPKHDETAQERVLALVGEGVARRGELLFKLDAFFVVPRLREAPLEALDAPRDEVLLGEELGRAPHGAGGQ